MASTQTGENAESPSRGVTKSWRRNAGHSSHDQCPVSRGRSGHEVSVCNFSRHLMSCSQLQSPCWSVTPVMANQRRDLRYVTNQRPGPSTAPAAWRGISHIFVQITGHCSADAWEPWTDPLDPGTGRLKKLVILKEVVCDGSKMKLNDMVSQIGQSSLSSSPWCRHHWTHYLTTLITLHNLVSDSGSWPY